MEEKGVEGLGTVRRGEERESMGWVDEMYGRELDRGPSAIQRLAILRAPQVRSLVKVSRNRPSNGLDSKVSPTSFL